MNFLVGFIVLFTVFILLLLLGIHLKTYKQGKHFFERLHRIKGFSMSQFIMGQQNSFLLAIDKENRLVAYILPNSQLVFPYDQVLRVEMLKDNQIVSERFTSRIKHNSEFMTILHRKPQTPLPLKSVKSKSNTSQIVIRITLSKGDSPWLPIYCFDAKTQLFGGSRTLDLTNKESQMYREGLEIAYHLDMLFGKIIDLIDDEYILDKVLDPQDQALPKDSIPKLIADELEKLFDLKERGALSREEYATQKERLLNF